MNATALAQRTQADAAQSRMGQLRRFLGRRTEWRAALLVAVLLVAVLIFEPTVVQSYPVTLDRIALIGLVALGLTVVILMGELDLSVASTLAVAGVVMASIPNIWLGSLVALAVGVVIGLVNAFFVVKVGINSFIATLGMLFALRGVSLVLADEKPVPLTDIEAGIRFGLPIIGPLTPRILIFLGLLVALQIFVTLVRSGRELYAVGGNRQAARDAGIPVNRRITTGFVISGVVAALAGVINTMQLTAADPTAGSTVLLSSIAAAIIGGVALTGGRGSIVGTLLGATALGILQVGLTIYGVQVDIQQIFIGGVLLLAVMTDPSSLRFVRESLRATFQGWRAGRA